ncbi:uncharacterized protein NEMAJ01_1313 [Nematocida major]|uniref:uncharacterized protein n=1 Tax=Nematocida major TaxID=1912982 RepID=UPI002008AF1E|nr:uncharacterized protein NEMAJ01_1313 [Nematocida major]KAH9386417.1 hypothetical protein NEMAJ01_1313 [Nematocida major]
MKNLYVLAGIALESILFVIGGLAMNSSDFMLHERQDPPGLLTAIKSFLMGSRSQGKYIVTSEDKAPNALTGEHKNIPSAPAPCARNAPTGQTCQDALESPQASAHPGINPGPPASQPSTSMPGAPNEKSMGLPAKKTLPISPISRSPTYVKAEVTQKSEKKAASPKQQPQKPAPLPPCNTSGSKETLKDAGFAKPVDAEQIAQHLIRYSKLEAGEASKSSSTTPHEHSGDLPCLGALCMEAEIYPKISDIAAHICSIVKFLEGVTSLAGRCVFFELDTLNSMYGIAIDAVLQKDKKKLFGERLVDNSNRSPSLGQSEVEMKDFFLGQLSSGLLVDCRKKFMFFLRLLYIDVVKSDIKLSFLAAVPFFESLTWIYMNKKGAEWEGKSCCFCMAGKKGQSLILKHIDTHWSQNAQEAGVFLCHDTYPSICVTKERREMLACLEGIPECSNISHDIPIADLMVFKLISTINGLSQKDCNIDVYRLCVIDLCKDFFFNTCSVFPHDTCAQHPLNGYFLNTHKYMGVCTSFLAKIEALMQSLAKMCDTKDSEFFSKFKHAVACHVRFLAVFINYQCAILSHHRSDRMPMQKCMYNEIFGSMYSKLCEVTPRNVHSLYNAACIQLVRGVFEKTAESAPQEDKGPEHSILLRILIHPYQNIELFYGELSNPDNFSKLISEYISYTKSCNKQKLLSVLKHVAEV